VGLSAPELARAMGKEEIDFGLAPCSYYIGGVNTVRSGPIFGTATEMKASFAHRYPLDIAS
jgi:hypothetical protein